MDDLLNELKRTASSFKKSDARFNNRDSFYKTKQWIHTRAYIVERDNNECQPCKDRGRVVINNLAVHHIEPLEFKPDRALDPNNLITVCASCHNFIHERTFGFTSKKSKWDDEYW